MTVEILGTAAGYLKAITDSIGITKSGADDISRYGNQASNSWSSAMQRLAQGTVQALSQMGIERFLRGAFSLFEYGQSTMMQLTAAIQVNGKAVNETIGDYQNWAKSLSKVSTTADIVILKMLKQAEGQGLSTEMSKMAVQNAIALAASEGGSAESKMHEMMMFSQGHIGRLGMHLGLSGMKEGPEKLDAAQAKLTKMFEVARAEAQTTQGSLKQLQNVWNNLKADLGEIVDKALKPLVTYTKLLVTWLNKLSPSGKETISIMLMVAASFVTIYNAASRARLAIAIMFSGVGVMLALIAAVGFGISTWVSSVGGLGEAWKIVQSKALEAWDYIRYYFNRFIEWAKPYWQSFTTWTSEQWIQIKDIAKEIWEDIKDVVASVIWWIKNTWSDMVGALRPYWDEFVNWLGIKTLSIKDIWQGLKDGITNIGQKISDVIDYISPVLKGIGVALVIIGSIGIATGGLIVTGFIKAYEIIKQIWDISIEWISNFLLENKDLVIGIATATAAFIGVYYAIKLVITGITLTIAVMNFLRVTQLISIVAWATYITVIFAVKAVLFLLFATYSLLTGGIVAQKIAMLAQTIVMIPVIAAYLLYKAVIWLVTAAYAALTTANLIATGVFVVSAGVVATVLAVAFIGLYGVVMGVIGAFKALGEGLRAIAAGGSNPVGHITTLFGEWKGYISEIIDAMKYDMPGALKLAGAVFKLVIIEIKELWQPLWNYLREGFTILWEYVSSMASIKTRRAIAEMVDAAANKFATKEQADANRKIVKLRYDIEEIEAGMELEKSSKNLKFAAPGIPKGGRYTEGRRQDENISEEASRAYQEVLDRLAETKYTKGVKIGEEVVNQLWSSALKIPQTALSQAEEDAFKAGNKVGEKLFQGFKQSPKLEPALVGSAEALARTITYREHLAGQVNPNLGQVGKHPGSSIYPTPLAKSNFMTPDQQGENQLRLLQQIRDILAQKGPIVTAANLGGPR